MTGDPCWSDLNSFKNRLKMEGIPPANLAKLVSAQQLVVGVRTVSDVPRQTNHTLEQQPGMKADKTECSKNLNLESSGVEDGRYRQGVGTERTFYSRREDCLEYSDCERRNHIQQEGPTNQAHVICQSDRGVGKDKRSRYIGNISSSGWILEDSVQTNDEDRRIKDDISSSSSLSYTNSTYSSSAAGTSLNTENISLLALPSDLSTASTMLCSQSLLDQAPSPPPSLPPSLPPQPLRPSLSSLPSLEDKRKIFMENACNYPDTIVWSDTKKFVVHWNKEGKLGFNIKDVRGRDGSEIYAMVTNISRGSPAHKSGLSVGDRVLSINGTPIYQQQTKQAATSKIIKQQSRDSPVSIVIQRPISIRVGNSAKSEMCSIERVAVQRSFRATFGDNDTPMKRLLDLRLVVMGSDAENMVVQLVGSKIWSERWDGPISKRCCVKIQKKDGIFEYVSGMSHQVMDILKSLHYQKNCHVGSNGISDSLTASECVVLEVVVLEDSRFADYCSQLVMTSHCMYFIGFDGQSFLDNTENHVNELQGQLNKIRTYAGSESPVYLISAWQHLSADTLESIEDIGMQLHQRFGEAFGGQLQYHGNCPCFMLGRVSPPQRQLSSQVPLHNQCQHQADGRVDLTLMQDHGTSSAVKFCTQSSTSTVSSSSSMLSSMNSCPTCFSDCGPEACLALLRDHISRNVFEQSFVMRKNYPQKFLFYRDIIIGLRDQKQKCVMTSGVKRACGIRESGELTSLLEYLHRQGVIISPANEKDGPHCSFVALNPEDLIHICKSLIEVPEVSRQDPAVRQHWSKLWTKSILTPALLTHLLGMESDAACITVCLQQLNLIHDCSRFQSSHLSCDSPPTERRISQQASYLMPFHINNLVPRGTTHRRDSSERMLLADFKGYCPHGLFSKLAIELGRLASVMGGTFELESEKSWVFNMGGNYTIYMSDDDPGRCMVKFITMCKVGFLLQNVLNDIRTAVMKVMRADHGFSLGPPCPMDQRCKHESSSLSVPHIIDLSKECGERPLWCGDEDVRKYSAVSQWIVSCGKETRGSPPMNSSGLILHRDTPFSLFPPDLFQLVCNRMNPPAVGGRDWRGLAGQLGYTISDLKLFENTSLPHQHYYDPCRHLLEDWGKSGNATLGNLINNLKQPNLNRQDVIMEIKTKWKVMDN